MSPIGASAPPLHESGDSPLASPVKTAVSSASVENLPEGSRSPIGAAGGGPASLDSTTSKGDAGGKDGAAGRGSKG